MKGHDRKSLNCAQKSCPQPLGALKGGRRYRAGDEEGFRYSGPVIVGVHVDYRDNHQLFEMIRGDGMH